MLAVGVFYTFALCMVEDVDASLISAEYYYLDSEPAEAPEEGISDNTNTGGASADREYFPQTRKPETTETPPTLPPLTFRKKTTRAETRAAALTVRKAPNPKRKKPM